MKSVRIWRFFRPCFPVFGRNTERYEVTLHIQSECGKIWTRKTLNTDTFHAVWNLCSLTYLLENNQVRQFVKIMISSTLLTYVHNLLRSELSSKNSELLYACSLFCFCQLIGNVVIGIVSGNCRVQFTNPIFCHLINETPVQVPFTNFPVDTRYL